MTMPDAIPCAICGKPARTMEHNFFEGVGNASRLPSDGKNCRREWIVIAPVYYLSTEDFHGMVEGYCGAKCSAEAYQRRLDAAERLTPPPDLLHR